MFVSESEDCHVEFRTLDFEAILMGQCFTKEPERNPASWLYHLVKKIWVPSDTGLLEFQ